MEARSKLLYTTSEGGYFKFVDADQAEEAMRTGRVDVTPGDVDRSKPGFKPEIVNADYVGIWREVEWTYPHDR